MLVGPAAAARCVRSFNGRILFMPTRHAGDPLMFSRYDYNARLTLLSYYLLVLWSLTGISSLAGCTDTIDAREVASDGKDELSTTDDEVAELALARAYIGARCGGAPRLVRRFHYHFRLAGIRVRMFHLATADELHLVEFFHLDWWFFVAQALAWGGMLAAVAATAVGAPL